MSKKTKSLTIDPNSIKTRDHLMVKVINGVTKSGVQPDRKKEANKRESRRKVHKEDYE